VTDFRRQSVYDMPASKTPRCKTVLSLLTCEESVRPVVMNYLIDMARVESMALAPSTSMQECKDLAKQPNVSTVFDCEGNRHTYRGTSLTFDGVDAFTKRKGARLGLSRQEKINELEKRLRDAVSEATSVEQQLANLASERQKAERACSEYKAKVRAAQLEVDHARSTISMLESTRNQLEDVAQAPEDDFLTQIQTQAANIMEFHSKVEDARARKESLTREIAVLEERRAGLTKQLDARDTSLQVLKESRAAVKKDIKRIEQHILKLNQHKEAQDGRRAQWEQEVKTIQDGIDQAMETTLSIVESRENAAERKESLVRKYRSKGLSVDDIEKMFTRKALEKKYQHLSRTIEDVEREAGGNLADLEVELASALDKLRRDGHDMAKNLNLFKGLQEAYKKREAKLFQVDDYVERTVSAKFKHYMKKKGHFGQIRVKRKEKKLEIGVRIGQDKNKDAVIKDLKQLSGGERSFATVAFALALGGETDTPFRAMDEFDVFMDSVNRKIAMENLISFAAENPNLQFIFLTPQDMSVLVAARDRIRAVGINVPDDFIKVVSMKPPRGGSRG
jgi:chromosome segregation ATPase